jgi:hypothetical protein
MTLRANVSRPAGTERQKGGHDENSDSLDAGTHNRTTMMIYS